MTSPEHFYSCSFTIPQAAYRDNSPVGNGLYRKLLLLSFGPC